MRAAVAGVGLAAVAFASVVSGQDTRASLADALRTAVAPALPFPEARADGTAPDSDSKPVWLVRWPEGGTARIEVLANPLNAENRARALEAEDAIQKSAMASQERSQADYERALRDFARSGRVGEIREVSLNDEGLAGERYDAESQATIEAQPLPADYRVEVRTSRAPEVFAGSGGPSAIVRLAANEFTDTREGADALQRFCPEHAWVVFGGSTPTVTFRRDAATATLVFPRDPGAARPVVVLLRGNVGVVDRVLQQATWAPLHAAR